MTGVVTAGSGQPWESALVAQLERAGSSLTVVRRCADLADVLATAATGRARVAVLDGSLRRLDTDAVQRLQNSGVAVLGVHPAGDERLRQRLERLGISSLVSDDAGPTALVAATRAALADTTAPPQPGAAADLRHALPPTPVPSGGESVDEPEGPVGRVVAVWGPTGAPGRSTVALGLADALTAAGSSTLLVDADVYGGVLANALGVLDESPGLAGACRLAANGRLDAAELQRLCWAIAPDLTLLTGISRADRWPELRPSAMTRVLAAGSQLARLTVVDCGFSIEADEELSFDTLAPRRNGATLAVLSSADRLLVVGAADPAGIERLVRCLDDLSEVLPEVRPEVVLNRVRGSAATAGEAAAALRRFTGLDALALLPEDRASTDTAWRLGERLSVAAPKSPLRVALAELATAVVAGQRAKVPVSQ